MKIATWNLERLKHHNQTAKIISILESLNAEIIVLTEYDERIQLAKYPYQISTKPLQNVGGIFYEETEKRVKIYSKYKIVNQFETYDNYTSCCCEIETENGDLIVYGTVIGIFGNRHENFKIDLAKQISDFENFSKNKCICIVGDFNVSFSDNYYYTKLGREALNKTFNKIQLKNVTSQLKEAIDHIVISSDFIIDFKCEIDEWNLDCKLSDHKGVCVTLSKV